MPTIKDETYYLSNCRARQHARMFGSGAFYDLGITGRQATQATNLTKGQRCIVATPLKSGKIEFAWFSFSRESIKLDDDRIRCRVFFGIRDPTKGHELTKGDAAQHPLYSIFFNKNGDFKRGHSVLRH